MIRYIPGAWPAVLAFDKVHAMPPTDEPIRRRSLDQLVQEMGLYAPQAFEFVQEAVGYTAQKVHGKGARDEPDESRHISGRQLCEGLRDFARDRWGRLAGTVLRRWGLRSTLDFGRIVFALVDGGWLRKTREDSLNDFRDVFNFDDAFEAGYQIASTK